MLSKLLHMALALRGVAEPEANRTCSRGMLREAVDRYIAAQSTGKVEWLGQVLSENFTFVENNKEMDMDNSTLRRRINIDYTHSIYDTTQCAAFTELIATNPDDPFVIGAQIRTDKGWVSKIDRVVTTNGDWLFNASHTLHYALLENWHTIPTAKRDSRETLRAAADAYFDAMHNSSVVVPWGYPCTRLEGGSFTGTGQANDTCEVNMPSNPTFIGPQRRYVIDESVGAVSVILLLSGFGDSPDSHFFRIEGGKFRKVHTATYCEKKPNCGVAPPDLPYGQDEDPGY